MGTYVDKNPANPFSWNDTERFSAGVGTGSYTLVTDKYEQSMELADTMLEKLIGVDGNSGYLGVLNSIIEDFPAPVIDVENVDVPDLSVTPDTRPPVDTGDLDLNFPDFTTPAPVLETLPSIDLSKINPADLPDEITAAINWTELAFVDDVYSDLLTRVLTDLQTGATGLDPTVEQEIFDRAIARQSIESDKKQQEIEEYFASRGFDLPPGAMAGRLQEQTNEVLRNTNDLNGKILIEQAELAQKNSQFIIGLAKDMESLLRDSTNKRNDRNLDYAKAVAANTIAIYSETIKAYIASAEANKIYVEVQVANLKATVEYNNGLVASFRAEADAYNTVIKATSGKNSAIIDAIEADIKGYDSETRAIAANQDTQIKSYQLKINNADANLRGQIAVAEQTTKGYTSESALRERVAESMANIAMQSLASALGSVNASAGLSNSASESLSESYGHNESRSTGWSNSDSLSESHPFEAQAV